MILKRIKNKIESNIHSYIDKYKSTPNLLLDNKYYHSQKINQIFKKVGHIPKRGTKEYYKYKYHISAMKNIEDILEKRENYSKFELFEVADDITYTKPIPKNIFNIQYIPTQQRPHEEINKKDITYFFDVLIPEKSEEDLFNFRKRYSNLLG